MSRTSRPLRVLAWPHHTTDRGNPYIDLLYGSMDTEDVVISPFSKRATVQGRWDIIHLHWPEWAVRLDSRLHSARDIVELLTLIKIARRRGARLVWTAHDLGPHDAQGSVLIPYFRLLTRQVDGLIALTGASLRQVLDAYPSMSRASAAVIPHGHYRDAYRPWKGSRASARRQLALPSDGRLLLFIGQVRPYKNADGLVQAFRRVAATTDRLVVAGEPIDAQTAQVVADAVEDDPRITLRLTHVEDDDVGLLLAASDAVVLPYHRILNSGAALLGLSFDRPIVAPAQGSLLALAERLGSSWVQLFRGTFDDADMQAALDIARPDGPAPLDHLDWSELAAQTVELYRRALAR